jgi:hypothetical protein
MTPSVRLHSQRLVGSTFTTPKQVVSWLGGMQGQDLASATWSIGLRLPGSVVADVEHAFATGALVRTWPMRGTLHVVAAEDLRWLISLTAKGNVKRAEYRRRQLDIDEKTLLKSEQTLHKELEGQQLTREELFTLLERAKISTGGQRGYHLLWHAAVNALLCYAAPRGKEQTFALLDDWLPPTKPKSHDEALTELARRYFQSRHPATLKDFTWWSGLPAKEARAAMESVQHEFDDDSSVQLPALALPGFDEYLLGYQDRSAVLDARHAGRIVPGGNGVFQPTVVLDGRVVGTWRRASREVDLFVKLGKPQRRAVDDALARYAQFLGSKVIGSKAPRSRRARSAD